MPALTLSGFGDNGWARLAPTLAKTAGLFLIYIPRVCTRGYKHVTAFGVDFF